MTRRDRDPKAWQGPINSSGGNFNPEALAMDLMKESQNRKKRECPNSFHVIRRLLDTEDVIQYMTDLDPVSRNAGELAFSYFSYERNMLNEARADQAVNALSDEKEIYTPTRVKAVRHSPVHYHVSVEFTEAIESLKQNYANISSSLSSTNQRIPAISPRIGAIKLGRYRSKREAIEAKYAFREALPETLAISVPEVLHIPREKNRQIC